MTEWHQVTEADLLAHTAELEAMAEDPRYVDGSGYGFSDYLDAVESAFSSEYFPPAEGRWDFGQDADSEPIRQLRKLARRVWREMRDVQ